jgi:hypothetical protein
VSKPDDAAIARKLVRDILRLVRPDRCNVGEMERLGSREALAKRRRGRKTSSRARARKKHNPNDGRCHAYCVECGY